MKKILGTSVHTITPISHYQSHTTYPEATCSAAPLASAHLPPNYLHRPQLPRLGGVWRLLAPSGSGEQLRRSATRRCEVAGPAATDQYRCRTPLEHTDLQSCWAAPPRCCPVCWPSRSELGRQPRPVCVSDTCPSGWSMSVGDCCICRVSTPVKMAFYHLTYSIYQFPLTAWTYP